MINQNFILFIVAVTFCAYVCGDVSHLAGAGTKTPDVTEVCLGCICEASSGCNRTLSCNGDVCGLFRITWAYWADSGKPTQPGESPDAVNAYSNCVNEPFCAARSVQGYMAKFGQDCNDDGKINCLDHAAIHIHGGYGCRNPLPEKYKVKFDECLSNIVQAQG
ncbi:lysozyme 1-like [Bradysia coprophila]|uniref:lysozyme 1-like n=1 Tax=Bradysia coprophila TaxID=38358 RepID=UPI00187DD05E|nr:lysozyme 1-like [Bradysia coprophila]